MIDFRYHLVSLMAVLIALTMGVILGAGPLQGNITATLSGEVDRLKAKQDTWAEERQQLLTTVSESEQYIQALGDFLDSKLLYGQKVALVIISDVKDKDLNNLKESLKISGAEIASEVVFTDKFFQNESAKQITTLADEMKTNLKFTPLPESNDLQNAYEGILWTLTKPTGQAGVDQTNISSKYHDLVKIRTLTAPATAAIVIAPNELKGNGKGYTGISDQGKIFSQLAQATLQVWQTGTLFTGNTDNEQGFLAQLHNLNLAHLVTADGWGRIGQNRFLPLMLRYSLGGGTGNYLTSDKANKLLPEDLKVILDTALPEPSVPEIKPANPVDTKNDKNKAA